MAGRSITGSTAIYMLSIADLYPIAQQLQGFAADDVFGTDALASAEVLPGVDNKLSGGYVYVPTVQNIHLQADSDSNAIFDNWWLNGQENQAALIANGFVSIPALGMNWTMTKGFLTSYQPISTVKKLLQPRTHAITWQTIRPAPSSA